MKMNIIIEIDLQSDIDFLCDFPDIWDACFALACSWVLVAVTGALASCRR